MTQIKRIERIETLAKVLLDEATEIRKSLAGQKPVRLSKGKNIIAKRLKTALCHQDSHTHQ